MGAISKALHLDSKGMGSGLWLCYTGMTYLYESTSPSVVEVRLLSCGSKDNICHH